MTNKTFEFDCEHVREIAFEYRRGELAPQEHKQVEVHVADCSACRDYLSRIDSMLTATQKHDFSADLDRDAMFQNILFEVQPAPPETVVQLRNVEAATDDEEVPPPTGNWFRVVAGLAAGVLIGVVIAFAMSQPTPSDSAGDIAEKTVGEQAPPDTSQESSEKRSTFANLSVQPSPANAKNVVVFGDESADWAIGGPESESMSLTSGTVLVEYVPKHQDAKFELVTDQFKVQVLGTVFYASEAEGVVGVVTGKVRVVPASGEPVVLERGQEYAVGIGVRDAATERLSAAQTHVDVDVHQLKLEAVPPKTVEKPPIRKKYSPEVVKTPRRSLRESAERALRAGRYVVAAEYYERMVDEFSAADPENATLRLDLSRIYIRHLKQPRRAVRHLKRFTQDRPSDPASPTAQSELCRISAELGMQEKSCEN